jgi:hypothetical protein
MPGNEAMAVQVGDNKDVQPLTRHDALHLTSLARSVRGKSP